MTQIVLEKHYGVHGRYMGMTVVYEEQLTPEFLDTLKKDKADKMGWKQYRKIMKDKGYDIE